MAIYHNSIRVLSSSSGRSCVQFSAYMAGAIDDNLRTGEHYDKTSKEEVTYSEMLYSENVPEELRNRSKFWNEVERYEALKSSKAQFSRTWEIALPIGLSEEEQVRLTKEYAESLLKDGCAAVQVAIHYKEDNPHAHLMAPCRQIDEHGQWKNKETKGYIYENENGDRKILTAAQGKELNPDEWHRVPVLDENGNQKTDSRNRKIWERGYIEDNKLNSREMIKTWRTRWADIANKGIDRHNIENDDFINHISEKTLKAQGIDRIATVHEGYAARQIEKNGGISEVCEKNRNIKKLNELQAEIKALQLNIMEQHKLIEKLKLELEKFLKEVSYGLQSGLHTAAERLRAAIKSGNGTDRTAEQSNIGIANGTDEAARRLREAIESSNSADRTAEESNIVERKNDNSSSAEAAARRLREAIKSSSETNSNIVERKREPGGRDIGAEIRERRITEGKSSTVANNKISQRANRDAERERLRIAESQRVEAEERRRIEEERDSRDGIKSNRKNAKPDLDIDR